MPGTGLALIPKFQNKLVHEASDKGWVMENVQGAGNDLQNPIQQCGTMYGLHVFRHRLFESNRTLTLPFACDHRGKCLGDHSRITKLDKHGNPRHCCPGNMYSVYGTPLKHTGGLDEWTRAMGMEEFNFSVRGITLAIPVA